MQTKCALGSNQQGHSRLLEDLMSPSHYCLGNYILSPLLITYLPFPKRLESSHAVCLLFQNPEDFLLFVLMVSKPHQLLSRLSICFLGQTNPFFVSPHNYFFLPHMFQQFSQSPPCKKKMFVSLNFVRSLNQRLVKESRAPYVLRLLSDSAAPRTNIQTTGHSGEGCQRLHMWQTQGLEAEYTKFFPLMDA